MRNTARALFFDVGVPVLAVAGLLGVGVVLRWPAWWVSLASILVLLIVEGVLLNFYLRRRNGVSLGADTGTGAPKRRLVATALAALTLVAAVAVAYTHWSVPDRAFETDRSKVVEIASAVAEATATFSPADPTAGIERAASMMVPASAEAFRDNFGRSTADLARRKVSAEAQTISAGLESLVGTGASAVVVMRTSQNAPGQQVRRAVVGLRLSLQKNGDLWQVVDIAPLQRAEG